MSAEAAGYRVTLPEFEGPLDLLLHLCKTHELDIVNIPISFITQKYLEYLEVMQSMSVDVAADYLVMAAQLAYLKSRELVPTPEPLEASTEEPETALDPREELIRRLLEYQKYKDAAEKLGARPIEGRTVFVRGMPIEMDDATRPLAEQSVWKLIESFGKLLDKAGKTITTHNVVVDRMSIGARINQLADRLEAGGGTLRFDTCFDLSLPEAELRDQVVVTLLAILELARLKVVRVLQATDDETLFISQIPGTSLAVARRTQVTSDSLSAEAADEPDEAAVDGAFPGEPAAEPAQAPEAASSEESSEESSAASSEDSSDDASDDISEDISGDIPDEITRAVSEEISELISEETTSDKTERHE
jgi:segregation and condensation protein A